MQRERTTRHLGLRGVLLAALVAAPFGEGLAQRGVQVSRDASRVLVSKLVGDDRWSITYDYLDGSITGNVYSGSDEPVRFVDCEEAGSTTEILSFLCFGSTSCESPSCDPSEWSELGLVDLPRSFIQTPDEEAVPATGCAQIAGDWCFTAILPRQPPLAQSGVAGRIEQTGCSISVDIPFVLQGTGYVVGRTFQLTLGVPRIDSGCVGTARGHVAPRTIAASFVESCQNLAGALTGGGPNHPPPGRDGCGREIP